MVAVKTGFSSPSMPGMPAPMQPMGGLPPMPPMGGGALAPNPFAPLPPMPLAGMPPPPPMMQPPMQPPMARPPMPQQVPSQQGSNAPRRKRFGDSLEGMLGRNQGLGATAPQQRPLPMPPQMMRQQRMVAPGTPMMRTPTPRPMNQGGIVQYMEDGGLSAVEKRLVENHGFIDAGDGRVLTPGGLLYDADAGDDFSSRLVSGLGADQLGSEETVRMAPPDERITKGSTVQIAESPSGRFAVVDTSGEGITFSDIYSGNVSEDFAEKYSRFLDKDDLGGTGLSYTDKQAALDLINKFGYNYGGDYVAPAPVPAPKEAPAPAAGGPDELISGPAPGGSSGPAPAPAPAPVPAPAPAPSPSIPGSAAGPGSAVDATGNFGTGVYTADAVDPSEVNPIDYTQFTGDVGNFSGTPESSALFGPKINIPQSVSQYMTGPSGGLTTSYGPEMVATSPIGAIKLPARPVSLDIFDFLSSPTYGTMYSGSGSGETRETCAAKGMGYNSILKVCVPMSGDASYGTGSELDTGFLNAPQPMAMGGAVPMQTNIAGQPHGLAYINQDEEALLRSFGGSGIMGPGGIPSYAPREYGGGSGSGYTTGTGSKNFDSGYKPITTNYKAGDPDDDDDKPSSIGPSGYTSLDAIAAAATEETPSGKMDFGDEDYTPTSDALNAQLSLAGQTNITDDTFPVNFGATSSGKDFDAVAKADTDVSGAEFVAAGGLGTGDLGVSYMPEPVTLGSDDPVVFTDIMGKTYDNAADRDRANLGYQQASYQQGNMPVRMLSEGFRQFGDFESDEEANRRAAANYATDPTPPSAYNFQETPDIFTNMFPPQRPILPPKIGDGSGKDDKSTSDDGTSTVSNLLDLEPTEGGYSLVDLKKRISLAEGTSDKDGYKRLLGGQETNRFKIDPTKMTVQEILDFQNQRGEGTYAEYSKGVNKNLGKLNDAGTEGVISTPVGKYQIVGSTLQGLVDANVLDPNELFDANAQERAGTHLITKDLAGGKGLEDLKTGKMTLGEFETALGKQFEGIKRGLDDVIKEADEGATSDIQLESGPAQDIDVLDPNQFPVEEIQSMFSKNNKDKDKPTKQITSYTDKDGNTTVDNPKTPQNEALIAQLGLGSSLDDVAATGRDIGVPNAAEAAFLMEALGEMEFDDKGNLVGAEPNFLEETLGKVIRNLTLGAFDPNDPQKREDALAILDAYEKTGKFVYDGKEMSLTELIKASKDEGIEPAVIGVEGPDGKTVGFDDGTGFRNIMGDYNPVFSEDGQVFSGGSDTQNIKTGSTNVFGGGDTTTNITTGGDDGGSDTTDDVDLGHTVDEDGNIICNTEGYIYNPETKICELPKEEDTGSDSPKINIGTAPVESFDDVLARITTAAPNIAPISANVRPMQEGGMAGLNRAADNFLQALAG